MTEMYGKTQSDVHAEENAVCRQIVSNISAFGVTQRQLTFIIYLLSLELENAELMRKLTAIVKDDGRDAFITGNVGDDSIVGQVVITSIDD